MLPLSRDGSPSSGKQLDTSTYSVVDLAWTPDSRELIFSTSRIRSNLVRIAADGSGKGMPLSLPDASQPAVARRGNRLVYAEGRLDTNIWTAELDVSDHVAGPARKLIASSLREVAPQYSPDGTRIAFSSNRSGVLEIWVADADGGNAAQLTSQGALTSGSPRWSPDGRKIAFDCNLGDEYNVYVVNADGGKPQQLTHQATNIVPAWSPDGRRIFFGSTRSGRFEIWSMDNSGGTSSS